MLPFGPRLTTVFTSRWKALFWAAGVMITAYFTASEAKHEPSSAQPASVAATAEGAGQEGAGQTSPWAK